MHGIEREFKVSDPVPAVGEASTTGETHSLARHPPHTDYDVSGAPDRVGIFVVPRYAPLAPATGDPVFGFRFDWPARVAEVAPHLFAHGTAYLLGQGGHCLTSRSAAAFKGSIISAE